MATATELSDGELDAELKDVETKIRELDSVKKQLIEKATPLNEELARVRQSILEYVARQNCLRDEVHDRKSHRQTVKRLIELESQLQDLKLKNSKLLESNNKLRNSLYSGTKYSKIQKQKIAELESRVTVAEQELSLAKTSAQPTFCTVDSCTVTELKEQLNQKTRFLHKTKEELNETRHQLSDVKERLIVSEQVTAATQRRELHESSNSNGLHLGLLPQPQTTTNTAAGSEVLRTQYSELTQSLDARIVAVNMYQRNALTLKELQSVQALTERPIEAAEKLLDIIVKQPDAVYLCFLDVLKHTGQQHIYEKLVEGGYKDFDDQSSHTSIIRKHYVILLEKLDSKFSGLVEQLFADDVVNQLEKEEVRAEQTSFRANEKLLSVLSRKSPERFKLFLNALDNYGQRHVRDIITNRRVERKLQSPTKTQPLAAAACHADEDVTVRVHFLHISLREMIYQFLAHTIDLNRNNFFNKLATNNVLSHSERHKLRDQKVGARVTLMTMLRSKSQAEFASFLTSLGEVGQQSVVNAVQQAVQALGQTGQNPLLSVGRVVHTLPEDEIVVGVTSLANMIYVLRSKERQQIEVYDVITYRFQHCLTVVDARIFTDMTSCEHYLCIYIADPAARCVHRVDVGIHDSAIHWDIHDKPRGLSVNAAHNLLVTCDKTRKIKEFSSHGQLLKSITFPEEVNNPWHTIQLTSGQLIVCHVDADNAIHQVCMTSEDGKDIVHTHGGQRGSETGHYSEPRHLAVDNNDFVFVADFCNRRVTLLSPSLGLNHDQILSRDELKGGPDRLCLDVQKRRLYVADNDGEESKAKGGKRKGRVVVFSV